jgi:hypothetical protein
VFGGGVNQQLANSNWQIARVFEQREYPVWLIANCQLLIAEMSAAKGSS